MLYESLDEIKARQQYRLERARAGVLQEAPRPRRGTGMGKALAALWQWLVGYEAPAPVAARKG